MLTKTIEMIYGNDIYHITYLKDYIDKNEIQFNLVDVKNQSGLIIFNNQLTIHYYPLRHKNKIEYPFYVNENLERLKKEIVIKVIEKEHVQV